MHSRAGSGHSASPRRAEARRPSRNSEESKMSGLGTGTRTARRAHLVTGVITAFVALAVSVTMAFVTPGAARAAGTNDYPYASSAIDRPDPWGFYTRECTSFIAFRMRQHGVNFTNNMAGGHWGDATHWASNARALGYRVDSTPRVGAIAWWSVGHVAYVLQV